MKEIINKHNFSEEEIKKLPIRRKARGVILNKEGNLLCLEENNEVGRLLGLPGGTIEDNEDEIEGFKRETKEETGYDITDIKFIGTIEIVRKKYRSITNCYRAKTEGERNNLKLTKEEIDAETSLVEMPFNKALERISEEYDKNPNDNSIRLLLILEEVKGS